MKLFTALIIAITVFSLYPQNITQNREFRSIWVVTWEYISSGSTPEQNMARIRTILDNMKAANMTSVLWQVRQSGTAYYNSSYEPWGSYAGGSYPGFDPLEYAIQEAHKRGMELHAWFNVFASGSTAPGTPAYEHPEWICRDRDGIPMNANIALSPGLNSVRSYLENVAMEVVRNYDIDGFHLDYIRWNEYSNGSNIQMPETENPDGEISDARLNELNNNAAGRYLYDIDHPYSAGVPSGFPTWEDWWRSSVTSFVRELQDSIKSAKPWVKLSCAALGKYNWSDWNGYSVVFQDAALWFNLGYVDQIAGMHYHWTTGSGFLGMLINACPQCWSAYIQPGIAAGRLYTVGPPSYILDENNLWQNHPDIVNSCRTVPWVDGFQFFSYASWKNRNYFNEAGSTFFPRKTKVRNALASSETVPAPQLQIIKIDSLHYRLTVIPSAITHPHWFALYRSTSNFFSRDTSEIISVGFSDSIFTIDQNFTGLQDYNGAYKYSVTMLNRFWKESELSNIVGTDPIPSFAPSVVSTIPAEGDTIAVNAQVTINFSKTINRTNLQNCFTFTPSVTITNIYSEPRKVVLTTSGFNFSTNYTLKIDSLKDVNGRWIDGNNDGIEGDPFYLHFNTVDADSVGPVLVTTWPQSLDSVDIESVLAFYFNEPLTSSSLTGNIILYRDNVQVPSDAVLTNYGIGSVINVKPMTAFGQSSSYSCRIKKQVKDLFGNEMLSDLTINFTGKAEGYDLRTMIDDFSTATGWEQPGYSGSTVGIIMPGTSWTYSSQVYLPSTTPRRSTVLNYIWDPQASSHLIREYLSGGPARNITFDTSYTLQVYINGDGSNSLVRFALDEAVGSTWPNHEVSRYYKINWHGWKLVEWDLGDPGSVGSWIGNGVLDGTAYRIDSFQMTDTSGSATEGTIYFDNLRIVKKSYVISSSEEYVSAPSEFRLYQNYPNPFNPSTTISFDLDRAGNVSLEIYDILGSKVKTLVSDHLNPGHYSINFDASGLSSGQYIYRIISEGRQMAKVLLLIK